MEKSAEGDSDVEQPKLGGETPSEDEQALAQKLEELRQLKELAQHEVYAMEREVETASRRFPIRPRVESRRAPTTKFFGLAQSGTRVSGQDTGYAPQPTVQSQVTMVGDRDEEEEENDVGRRTRRGRSRSPSGRRKRRRASPSAENLNEDSALTRKKKLRLARENQRKTKGLFQRNQRFFERTLTGHLMAAIRDNKKRDRSRKHSIRKKATKLLGKQKQQVAESHKEILQRKLLMKRKENEAIQAHFDWQIQLKQNDLIIKKLKDMHMQKAKFCWTSVSGETSICWQPFSTEGKEEVFERILTKGRERLLKDFEGEARHIKENEADEPPLPASVIERRAAEKKRQMEIETAKSSDRAGSMEIDEDIDEAKSPTKQKSKGEAEIEADFPSADEGDMSSNSANVQPEKSPRKRVQGAVIIDS